MKLISNYFKAKDNGLTFEQYTSRNFKKLKDRITRKLIFHYIKDENISREVHSALILKKIYRRYNNCHNKRLPIVENNEWKNKMFPKIIWWCWLQGTDKMPELSKICLESLKKNLPTYEIRIITLDNLSSFINLPDVIVKKFNAGWISEAHFSDIIRLNLLAKYGGIWIDSTVYCTDNKLIKDIEKNNMFVYQNVMTANNSIIKMSNWLIATKKNNPYIIESAKLLTEYYKKSNYVEDYFICHLIMTVLTTKYDAIWNEMDVYNNIDPHMLQYVLNQPFSEKTFDRILKKASFHKLNRHINFKEGNTFYNYLKKRGA